MANSYTFTADKTVTIGNATKKTDIDVVAANTDYLKEALDTIMSSSGADGVVTASGLAIDTTTLVVDAANNRVGVGTASPASLLDASSSSEGLKIQATAATPTHAAWFSSYTTTTARTFIGHQNSTAGGIVTGGGINYAGVFRADAGVHIVAGSSASDGITIDSSANVGVGTTSFGTSAAGVFAIANGTQGAALANAIQIVSEDLSAGNTIPSIRTEGSGIYSAGTPAAATGSIALKINGTVYHLTASTTAAS